MDILRGLPQLTWLEIKIFLREPLGAIGSIAIPVLAFVVTGRVAGRAAALPEPPRRASATSCATACRCSSPCSSR